MKYWKLLLLFLPIFLFIVGCAPLPNYDISLEKVNLLTPTKTEYTNIQKVEGVKNSYIFTDDLIEITWGLSATSFGFNLKNKTSDSIEIVWDKCAYVDVDNKTHRLIHAGVKYIDRDNSQPNTMILPNASIDDMIYPSDYIYYREGWHDLPLFKNIDEVEMEEITQRYIGKTVQGLLSLKSGEVIYSYVFTFKINSLEMEKK